MSFIASALIYGANFSDIKGACILKRKKKKTVFSRHSLNLLVLTSRY